MLVLRSPLSFSITICTAFLPSFWQCSKKNSLLNEVPWWLLSHTFYTNLFVTVIVCIDSSFTWLIIITPISSFSLSVHNVFLLNISSCFVFSRPPPLSFHYTIFYINWRPLLWLSLFLLWLLLFSFPLLSLLGKTVFIFFTELTSRPT